MRETNLTKMKFFEEVAFKLSNEKKSHKSGKEYSRKKETNTPSWKKYWTDLKT